jgi:hypothetical protein
MGFLSDIFDPGKADREQASSQAQAGIINLTNTSGPGGITAGSEFADGQGTTELGLGSFQPLLDQAQGTASQGFAQAGAGFEDFSQFGDFGSLGDIFKGAQSTAQADPFDLGADVSARLRALSERRNQRTVNRTFDRLKASGNLGSSAGIARAGDLERNMFEQGLQFDLAGLQAGQSLQKDAFSRVLGSQQSRGNIFQQFLANQAQGANIGFGGIQSAAGLAQLPLSFLQAGGAEASRASNTNFAAAGISSQNAANAKSPFLEVLNAAGGLATGFNSFGIGSGA